MYLQLSRLGVFAAGLGDPGGLRHRGVVDERSRRRPARTAVERAEGRTRMRSSLSISRAGSTSTWSCTTGWRKQAPPLKETKDPAQIKASQDVLAQKIREARKGAQPGEIFTPEIRQHLRRLMYPETKGADGRENKAAMAEEKGELKDVAIKVNAAYPDSAPLMTVAPDILAALPKLPEDLEYRFVNRHMILLDVHANLIVDYVLNAIQ